MDLILLVYLLGASRHSIWAITYNLCGRDYDFIFDMMKLSEVLRGEAIYCKRQGQQLRHTEVFRFHSENMRNNSNAGSQLLYLFSRNMPGLALQYSEMVVPCLFNLISHFYGLHVSMVAQKNKTKLKYVKSG